MPFPCRNNILPLSLAVLALGLTSACSRIDEEGDDAARPGADTAATAPQAEVEAPPPPTPQEIQTEAAREALAARISEIGEDFGGDLGIAVHEVEGDWATGFNADTLLPQQSVSKLWVALTVLDRRDRGTLPFDKTVTMTAADLTLFHQPIRKEILARGTLSTTPADLMQRALTKSDNTANNKLLEEAGGPDAVRSLLARKAVRGIRFGPGERKMQSAIAGLDWDPRYSIRNTFFDARDEVPDARRRIAFEAYLDNPVDGASAGAIAAALARLARGELLSPASTKLFIDTLTQTSSGPRRLKGGVSPGWTIAHKTGTGQFYDGQQSGYNDVALLYAPDGAAYAIAVMIGRTTRPTLERMAMMQSVTRAVIAYDTGRDAPIEAGEGDGEGEDADEVAAPAA